MTLDEIPSSLNVTSMIFICYPINSYTRLWLSLYFGCTESQHQLRISNTYPSSGMAEELVRGAPATEVQMIQRQHEHEEQGKQVPCVQRHPCRVIPGQEVPDRDCQYQQADTERQHIQVAVEIRKASHVTSCEVRDAVAGEDIEIRAEDTC